MGKLPTLAGIAGGSGLYLLLEQVVDVSNAVGYNAEHTLSGLAAGILSASTIGIIGELSKRGASKVVGRISEAAPKCFGGSVGAGAGASFVNTDLFRDAITYPLGVHSPGLEGFLKTSLTYTSIALAVGCAYTFIRDAIKKID